MRLIEREGDRMRDRKNSNVYKIMIDKDFKNLLQFYDILLTKIIIAKYCLNRLYPYTPVRCGVLTCIHKHFLAMLFDRDETVIVTLFL